MLMRGAQTSIYVGHTEDSICLNLLKFVVVPFENPTTPGMSWSKAAQELLHM